MNELFANFASIGALLALGALLAVLYMSFWKIGPTELGLVRKRFARRKLDGGNIVGFKGEAGYQAELLRTGIRFKLWPLFAVQRRPIPQIPAGEIAVVIAQVGAQLPVGAKSAIYKSEFGNFTDLKGFVEGGGQGGCSDWCSRPARLRPSIRSAFW
jgi:uncharacterized membrane protein YqiK